MKIVKSAQHYTETAIDEIKLLRSVCQLYYIMILNFCLISFLFAFYALSILPV